MQKIMFMLLLASARMLGMMDQANQDPIVYLFAHGLYANAQLADYYSQIPLMPLKVENNVLHAQSKSGYIHQWNLIDQDLADFWIIKKPYFSFNFPDAADGFNGSHTSLAQENEIQALVNAYEKIKFNKVVLVGMSRGASAILNFLGTKSAHSVAAAVVESPFDSITDILDSFCRSHWWIPAMIRHTSPNLLFSKFNRQGIFPIKVAPHISKHIPILIIASLEDSLIPAINSASIYLKLRECGHFDAYFLLLNKGKHAYLLESDNTHIYLNVVHAFYKNYELPYNTACATQGDTILTQCQPSKKSIDEAFKQKKSFITQ